MVDENRARFKHNENSKSFGRIISGNPANDWPAPIRGDAPIDPNPHGHFMPASPSRVEETTASRHRGPHVGDSSTRPTPGAVGGIGPFAKERLDHVSAATRAGIRKFLDRNRPSGR